MNQHFLNLIAAEPENRTHQLVYADWLEEQGDPRYGLIRMSESWAEAVTRLGIQDWGIPAAEIHRKYLQYPAISVYMGEIYQIDHWQLWRHTWDGISLYHDSESFGDDSFGKGVAILNLPCLPRLESRIRCPELMPPG